MLLAISAPPGVTDGRLLGQELKGHVTWSSLAPRTVSQSRGVSVRLLQPGAEVGTRSSTVAGVNNGEIYAVCDDGTRVQGTFVIGSGTASGTGTATDTNGNVYKLLF